MEKPRRRVRALGLHWVALVSLTVGGLASGACSDDATTGTKPAAGGEGGEPTAVGGAPGGAPAVAGSAQQAGAAGQSEGGAGGMPAGPTVGEACTACGATACGDELDSCTANAECAPWLTCITACDDEACIDACDETHADVARIYYGIYDCLCGACEDECAAGKSCDKQCVPDDVLPTSDTAPATLAETGLYAGYALGDGGAGGAGGAPTLDPATEPLTPADYVHLFEPKYPLWADGAEKERYIYIPKCSTIDTSDQDHWEFPVGTRIWKLFTVPGGSVGAGGTRVETRMLHHYGPGEIDWLYAAYQWDVNAPDDPAAALLVGNAGVTSANGTTHDIPSVDQCQNCHGKLSERVLGFGAFQLSHASSGDDLTIEKASNLGWFSDPAPEGFQVPGSAVQQAALGYLHGNCGGCHAQGQGIGAGVPNNNTELVMRLAVSQTDYADTDTVKSSVGVVVASGLAAITGKPRIDPMAPANSAILLRMNARGIQLQMPPLITTSTKVADTAGGVADVTAWVNSIQ